MNTRLSVFVGIAVVTAALPMKAAAQDPFLMSLTTNSVKTNVVTHTLAAKDAAGAWDELQDAASHRPTPPDEWQLKEPSPEEQARFFLPLALALADKSVDFYTRFPGDTNEISARLMELGIVTWAVENGATNEQIRFDKVEKAVLADTNLSEDDRFEIRDNSLRRAVHAKEPEGDVAMLAEFEKGARMIQKEFPKRPEYLLMLLQVAQNSDPAKAREVLKELSTNTIPDELKDAMADMQKSLDKIGTPMALKFTAVDGRAVDITNMQGKVVLVNFWATGSEAALDMLSDLKDSYDKLHDKGLEIVGINMDEDKENLADIISAQKIVWPQYFDGLAGKSKVAVENGVKPEDLPAAWLVDKKGVLRYINAGFDMEHKIDKLLAE